MSVTAKINRLVRQALPKGRPLKIIWRRTGLRNSRTLRVVTPAWKTLSRHDRILRLENAIATKLSARERSLIFRISVLTPAEFKRLSEVVPARYLSVKTHFNGGNGLQVTKS